MKNNKKIINLKPLYLTTVFALTGCVSSHQIIKSDPVLNKNDCSITQTTTLTEKQGSNTTLVATDSRFVGFDPTCAQHEERALRIKNEHQERLAQLNAATQILVVGFSSTADEGKRSEYLQHILTNLASDNDDIRTSQERMLVKYKYTQNDIIRAEVIDLINQFKSDDTATASAAAAEILKIHRQEKYPERMFVPRQIVEKELHEKRLTIRSIEDYLTQQNPARLSICKPVENQKTGKVVFSCN